MVETDITELLNRMSDGDRNAGADLLPIVYRELRRIAGDCMRGERQGHSMQATDLVHEAFVKLVGRSSEWESRRHFFGVAASAMRNVLVDRARERAAEKRGGEHDRVPLDDALALYERSIEDILALDEALTRLGDKDPELARIVELRFFGGLNNEETAKVLDTSLRSVERLWTVARAWLRAEI